jgi:hypothetical protein
MGRDDDVDGDGYGGNDSDDNSDGSGNDDGSGYSNGNVNDCGDGCESNIKCIDGTRYNTVAIRIFMLSYEIFATLVIIVIGIIFFFR